MSRLIRFFMLILSIAVYQNAFAQNDSASEQNTSVPSAYQHHMTMNAMHGIGPKDCSGMTVWDIDTGMCMPYAMEGMPMSHLMIHGNGFAVLDSQSGPRGRTAFAGPDMFMADAGFSTGGMQFFNLEFMGTLEKWTYPDGGYPELLQIGEQDGWGNPFIDRQHPHNSPIMGLTLSDRITLGPDAENLKIFVAPRGQTTDGPIPFMHRETGLVNPDAPLGHHIGQDVGHVTSTVAGVALDSHGTYVEASAFNGTEPDPTKVDLPIGPINSGALRIARELTDSLLIMGSAAYVTAPEPDSPDIPYEWRYSASLYDERTTTGGYKLANTLVWGAVTNYDHADFLMSFLDEYLLSTGRNNFWGRLEVVQRTPGELDIPSAGDPNSPQWVSAITIGYTRNVVHGDGGDVGIGASVTENFLPSVFQCAYGGDPWAAKVFMQFSGMGMFDL